MRTDLNAIETATVLAALRLFQKTYADKDEDAIRAHWPEHFADVVPLSTEGIDELCELINREPETQQWKIWPTHWAGGSNSVQVDGHNTIWIMDENGAEVCRMRTEPGGRVTAATYARAQRIVDAVNKLRTPAGASMEPEALNRLREAEGFIGAPATETLPFFRESRREWLRSVRAILTANGIQPENLSGEWHT